MVDNPFKYQLELLGQYKEANEANQKAMSVLLEQGYVITLCAELYGPYTSSTTYWWSNGACHTIITPSRLNWVPLIRYY